MLEIHNYSKRYGDHLILEINALTLTSGMIWVKGENGSGKSTFFKSVAGLIPFEGSIKFPDGISPQKKPVDYRLRVNYSEAEPLYPTFLSANDLIRFVAGARKSSFDQQQHYIQAFGIESFMHSPCGSYSSGMLKKVSLVMAFLGNSSLIILDEPLITLDAESRNILTNLIRDRQRDRNDMLFLVSSHQQIDNIPISKAYTILNKTLVEA
jgi:ABC-2 type transport system ATP-binding protein